MMKPWKIDTKIKKQKTMSVFLDKSIVMGKDLSLARNVTLKAKSLASVLLVKDGFARTTC